MRIARYLFAGLGVLFVVGVVVQVFLAGLFLFAGGERIWHVEFGYWLELPPLLMLLLAWPARIGRPNVWLTLGLAVDVFVQTSLPELKGALPWVAALHPVNALFVLWLGVSVATRGVALVRSTGRESSMAPSGLSSPESPARGSQQRNGMDWYPWVVLAHIGGGFTFVLAHGVSVFVAFAIRREREPARIGALLDVSSASLGLVYLSLLVLLVAGIAAGFMHDFWGRWWIWVSLAILIGLVVAMYPLGSGHYAKVRRAIGMKAYGDAKDAPPPAPLPAAELAAIVESPRPYLLAGLGGGALVIILVLMVLRPF